MEFSRRPNNLERQDYLRRLPLLDFTANLYPDSDLSDVYLMCAQHLVSTTYSLFDTLLKFGIRPENLAAIGKCYSTDPKAFQEMQKIGIDVCGSSLKFNSHRPFDEQYREDVRKFAKDRLKRINSNKFKKIIVLDDGGELIAAVNSLVRDSDKIVGIEQTSSGFQKLLSQQMLFPIINVARSPAKLNYETPIIAKLVLDTLLSHIEEHCFDLKKVLIIGNGYIGAGIKSVLKTTHEVMTFDSMMSKSCIKHHCIDKELKKFDLIIGCTGQPVLRPEHYRLLKNKVVLVSASSSDREFNSVHLRKKLPLVTNCHENLFYNGICLINCGFPINFSSDYLAIDCDALQLTRSLLLASILQANDFFECLDKGFVPLDIENQREIVREFLSIDATDGSLVTEGVAI